MALLFCTKSGLQVKETWVLRMGTWHENMHATWWVEDRHCATALLPIASRFIQRGRAVLLFVPSPKISAAATNSTKATGSSKYDMLNEVFALFAPDGSDECEAGEIMELATVGAAYVPDMDDFVCICLTSESGTITKDEFLEFFCESLPDEVTDEAIAKFKETGRMYLAKLAGLDSADWDSELDGLEDGVDDIYDIDDHL